MEGKGWKKRGTPFSSILVGGGGGVVVGGGQKGVRIKRLKNNEAEK